MSARALFVVLALCVLLFHFSEQAWTQGKSTKTQNQSKSSLGVQKPKFKTEVIRNNYAQQKYREQSKSNNKGDQHVAHTYSLEMAVHHMSSPTYKGQPDLDKIKKSINAFSNFRMAKANTNLKTHRRIDNSLIAKSYSGAQLTQEEERRAKMQANVIRNGDFPQNHLAEANRFYTNLNTASGNQI
jgi:hypothetical protein